MIPLDQRESHASAEIIARAGWNVSEDYPVKIGDAGEHLVNGAVTSHCNDIYRLRFSAKSTGIRSNLCGMSGISCKAVLEINSPKT